jgi:Tfp pilus assembly protein PilE
MKSPTYYESGFTLVETIGVILLAGILMTVAVPSFLSLNKPLRDGVSQFTSHINLVRSKAMASSKAYRIKPKYPSPSQYPKSIPNQFIVQYATNCQVVEGTGGWTTAAQFDLDLPENMGVTNDAAISLPLPTSGSEIIQPANNLDWEICFDSRGTIAQPSVRDIIFRDYQGNNPAKLAKIQLNLVGVNDIFTYSINPSSQAIAWIPKQDPSSSTTNCRLSQNFGKCTRNVF